MDRLTPVLTRVVDGTVQAFAQAPTAAGQRYHSNHGVDVPRRSRCL
jgi:hypothetical protein